MAFLRDPGQAVNKRELFNKFLYLHLLNGLINFMFQSCSKKLATIVERILVNIQRLHIDTCTE